MKIGRAVWPLAVRAQQPALPVIGFLSSLSQAESSHLVAGFRRGLAETGLTMEIRSENACEREADKLARDSLVPADILTQVSWGAATAHDDLITIAARARVHISVVAGRWQRDHQNYKKFARLIDRSSVRSMLSGINT
jgi:hypothetical protein